MLTNCVMQCACASASVGVCRKHSIIYALHRTHSEQIVINGLDGNTHRSSDIINYL